MHSRIFPKVSDFRPKIWASSDEVTPNFFRRVSVSIGMLRAVTSALGYAFDNALMLLLSRGMHCSMINILPSPFRQADCPDLSEII